MLSDHILDADQRLSQSLIWDVQRSYFLKNGMQAWQANVVPHTISSNPLLAHAYGQVVFGYLRDCLAAAHTESFSYDKKQPLYIIELGAGSGRLATHFLHHFLPRLQQSSFANLPVKYVMTDFVPQILDFWRQHEHFQPWIEAGVLDFALFDVMEQQAPPTLTLLNEKRTLTPKQITNPFVLIANYFFDSIPQDSFVLEDGLLCDNLLTLTSTQPEPDLADPAIWERLELDYEAIPLAQSPYEVDSYNEVLAWYEAYLPDTIFSFPNVGLDCLRGWQGDGANGRFLLLTADRGYTQAESLIGQPNPTPNLHGSFSLMVNYHAMSQYVRLNEGLVLQPAHYQDNLQISAYLLGQLPQEGMETAVAFQDSIGQAGPDDFYALKRAIEPHLNSFDLPQLLSYLRLSKWDADIFIDCFPALLTRVQQADPVWYADVDKLIEIIWRQYLPLEANPTLVECIKQLRKIIT